MYLDLDPRFKARYLSNKEQIQAHEAKDICNSVMQHSQEPDYTITCVPGAGQQRR